MKKLTFKVIMLVLFATVITLLCTKLFGNTSWLSGTGLTQYDKVYVGEGGMLRQVGERTMLPVSRIYYDYGRKVQEESVYDWSTIPYSNSLKYYSN